MILVLMFWYATISMRHNTSLSVSPCSRNSWMSRGLHVLGLRVTFTAKSAIACSRKLRLAFV